MRQSFLRLLILTSLLLTTAIATPLAQDDPIITVTPDSGIIRSAIMDISVSGLVADRTYLVEFVYDGIVVFSTDEVADADGNVTFDAASTEDDDVGIYTVQVVSNDSIIAATEFELTAGSIETNDSPSIENMGNINISPRSGPINTLHTITLSDLDSDTTYTVEVTASKTEEVVYRRVWTADEQGDISIEIFANDGDTAGQQVVSVFDSSGNLVAQGEFTVEEPPTRNIVVNITPTVAQAGREFTITVSGLAAFDSVSAQITSEDNILLDTVRARASSQGVAVLSFLSSDDLDDDTYNVGIFVEDDRMAESTLTIGDTIVADGDNDDAEPSDVTLTVDPESAPVGSTHIMTVTGLEAEQSFTLTINTDAGAIEYSTTRTADESGEFSVNISSSEGDETGVYPVEISDATTGQILATAQMMIASGDTSDSTGTDTTAQVGTPAISVSPKTGEIGTTYVITLSGMPVDDRIGVVIRAVSDNTLALSSVVATGDNGSGGVEFTSSELNLPGDYNVTVVQPSGELVSTTFTIEGAIATVEPQAGLAGTTHIITVSDLDSDETVTFDVTFDGESVYSTEKTADANGVVSMNLTTDDSDSIGDYTITVLRESGNQPTVIVTLIEEEVDAPPDTTEDDSTDEPIADAEVIEGHLSDGIASIEFEGEEGQYVIISVVSDDFDTVAAVYDHDYFEIAYNDDSLGQLNSRIGPLLLPYSGEYTLEVSPSYYVEDEVSGDEFVVTIEYVSVAELDFDEPLAFALNPQTSILYYELPVKAGDSFNITVDSNGSLDTVMQVISYDGYEFAFDDDSGAGFDAEFNNLIFETTGTYVLVVSSFSEDSSGDGVLSISRNPVKSLDDGDVTITLNDKVYREIVVFEGEEGQVITLNLERLSGEVEDLYVYANADGMQVMSYSTMGVPDNLPLTFVMPMSGQVVVTFEEYSFGGGISFNITVEKE
jgi:hypothetical protein